MTNFIIFKRKKQLLHNNAKFLHFSTKNSSFQAIGIVSQTVFILFFFYGHKIRQSMRANQMPPVTDFIGIFFYFVILVPCAYAVFVVPFQSYRLLRYETKDYGVQLQSIPTDPPAYYS
jgi:hypothetical protein